MQRPFVGISGMRGTKRMRQPTKQEGFMALEEQKLALLQEMMNKEQNNSLQSVSQSASASLPADEDEMFFETLLLHVQNISNEEKLIFRQELESKVFEFAYKNAYSAKQGLNSRKKTARRSRIQRYECDDDGM